MRENSKSERLFCLDALRGLDMLLLTVVGPFFMAVNKGYGLPEGVLAQFRHPWGGFTLWDIIVPRFIFMCGATGRSEVLGSRPVSICPPLGFGDGGARAASHA